MSTLRYILYKLFIIYYVLQVLDLYQNPKGKSEAPDSPPQLPPSKASLIKASPPPQKRAKLQQSPVMNPKVAVNHIPVKVTILIPK